MQAPLPTRRHRERICYDRSRAGRASGSAAHFCKSSRDSGGTGNEKQKEEMVRKGGLEPPRSCDRQPLKLVRLPIPPLPHIEPVVSYVSYQFSVKPKPTTLCS